MNFTLEEAWEIALLALCIWREARGEIVAAKRAAAWSISNRVQHPGWWGHDFPSVILKPKQYSSFNPGDPNSTKFPDTHDTAWQASLMAAESAYRRVDEDPIGGATNYFDSSLDKNPPGWAAAMTHVCDIGNLRFYK